MHRVLFLLLFGLQAAFVFSQNAAADSLSAAQQVDSLIQAARKLTGEKAFDKALDTLGAADKIALDAFGRQSVQYMNSCYQRSMTNYYKKDFAEAEKWLLEARPICEKTLGADTQRYSDILQMLAISTQNMGNLDMAERYFREAMAVQEKINGKDKNQRYANLLRGVSLIHYQLDNMAKALECNREVLEITKNASGTESPEYLMAIGNMGLYLFRLNEFEEAVKFMLETLQLAEKQSGKQNETYSGRLSDLGRCYHLMGNYERSEKTYLEAYSIQEKINRNTPTYANILNGLGLLRLETGKYEQAEELFLEARAIIVNTFGMEHRMYARLQTNLGLVYINLGNPEKRIQLQLEALDIYEKLYGKNSRIYIEQLSVLSAAYFDIGRLDVAERMLLDNINRQEQTLENNTVDYCANLINLALLYDMKGDQAKIEPLLLQAKDVFENKMGNRIHEFYMNCLRGLADLYHAQGKYGEAEKYYLEAKTIRENTIGTRDDRYLGTLQKLSELYERQGRYAESEALLRALNQNQRQQLLSGTTFLSEHELAKYFDSFLNFDHALNSCLLARPSGQTSVLPEIAYDNELFRKGFVLSAAANLDAKINALPELAEIYLDLKSLRRRLAAQYAMPVAERTGVAELEEKADVVEKELTKKVAGYAENTRQVRWQEVRDALRPGEVAIEFVHFRVLHPTVTDRVAYAALLLSAGSERPVFVPLSDEKALEALLKTSGARKSDYVNRVYGARTAGAETLHQLLWQPLEKHLPPGVATIYFSPTGLLHRLNLAAIPLSEGVTLADRFRFVQLGSTRQLLEKQTLPARSDSETALFGGVQFNMDEAAISKANAGLAPRNASGTRGEVDFSKTDAATRGHGNWEYLSWTEKEVDTLQKMLTLSGMNTALFKGFTATEEAFKSLRSPRVLHLATHGYFFPEGELPPAPAKGEGGLLAGPFRGGATFKISEHPMIRSGLILAGGNHAWTTGKPLKPDMEDGILTAYEIAQMDLSGTELVVLSACETGLGDIRGNEGVYGLQRAFKLAGVRFLIMSLWQVPDFQTQELMTLFYQYHLAKKMSFPEAFHAAQKEMRERYEHPYFWAGFVLLE